MRVIGSGRAGARRHGRGSRLGLVAALALTLAATVAGGAAPRGLLAAAGPTLSGCAVFPTDSWWNRRVDSLPVDPSSATYIASIGLTASLHPDFSAARLYGIPYNVVTASTKRTTVKFTYASESDQVGYPIPSSPLVEGGSDHHLLMLDKDACRLYELYAVKKSGTKWNAGSGATWDLSSNTMRPAGWTSADAAGLAYEALERARAAAVSAQRNGFGRRMERPHACRRRLRQSARRPQLSSHL